MVEPTECNSKELYREANRKNQEGMEQVQLDDSAPDKRNHLKGREKQSHCKIPQPQVSQLTEDGVHLQSTTLNDDT